jgi:hypothetical protein
LYKRAPQGYNGKGSVDGYSSKLGEVFAAVCISSEMSDGRMGKENDGKGRDLSGWPRLARQRLWRYKVRDGGLFQTLHMIEGESGGRNVSSLMFVYIVPPFLKLKPPEKRRNLLLKLLQL